MSITETKKFSDLMTENAKTIISHLFEENQEFIIVAEVSEIDFNPLLPDELIKTFDEMSIFAIMGYSFEVAEIVNDNLCFEAGFGPNMFGSKLTVPISSIMHINVDEETIFINMATYEESYQEKILVQEQNKSMNMFLSNPENSKFKK